MRAEPDAVTRFGSCTGSHFQSSTITKVYTCEVFFEVDKKFQRISIAFVHFYDLNDLKKAASAISIE